MLKAVLDTNVLVSALIVKNGKPSQIVGCARRGEFILLLSDEILEETNDVLHRRRIRKRFALTDEEIQSFLAHLRDLGTLISGGPIEEVIPNDPPDNLVLACAAGGQADFLVSGNDHFLKLGQYRGIRMVRPAEFLDMLVAAKSH